MRVLMLSDLYPPTVRGGLEFHVDGLACELTDRGHEVQVCTLSRDAAAANPGVRVHRIRPGFGGLVPHIDRDRPFHPPIPDPVVTRQLAQVLEEFRPDVIHGHTWMTVSLPRSRRAPLVFTAHDYGLVCQLRTLLRTDGVLCAGPSLTCLPCGSRRYGRATSVLLSSGTVAGRARLNPQTIVTVSGAIRDALAGHTRAPLLTIPCFLPRGGGSLSASPEPLPDRPYVMFAGDPGSHKGLDMLISLWAAQRPPAADLLVAVTKPYPRAVPPSVHVLSLERDQVLAAWSRASIAVVPSLWPEPFGTVALEAMAAGTPVLVSRLGGLAEIVRDGLDGFHVTPGDVEDLRGRIDQMLADDALRARLGAQVMERAKEYHPDVVLPRLERLYATLASGRA